MIRRPPLAIPNPNSVPTEEGVPNELEVTRNNTQTDETMMPPESPTFKKLKKPRVSDPEPPFFKAIVPLMKIAWPSWRTATTWLMITECALCVTFAWAFNFYSELTGSFSSAVDADNKYLFKLTLGYILFAVFVGGFVNGAIMYLGDRIVTETWSARLNQHFMERYMRPLVYYRVQSMVKDPDQRIGYDIQLFCSKLKILLFGTPLLVGLPPGLLSIFVSAVWLTVTIWRRGGWFCAVGTYAFFAVFAILNHIFAIMAAKATQKEKQHAAEYRFAHTYLRLHSEHVAFLDGHEVEESKLRKLLNNIVSRARSIALATFPINTSSNFFFIWALDLAYMVPGLSWRYVGGVDYDIDTFLALSSLVLNLMYNLTAFLMLARDFSEFLAATRRLYELYGAMEEVEEYLQLEAERNRVSFEEKSVAYSGVCFSSPGGALTLNDISFSIPSGGGDNLLIMGPSGIGKSSILRVLGGLWPVTAGSIVKPKTIGRNGITYMPQKPYLTLGTLKEQITYPDDAETIKDEEVIELLRSVQLDYILTRGKNGGTSYLHETHLWSEVLSGGEQQRLGVARILYQQPHFAVLDESTSAMDEDIEAHVYSEMCRRGISLISIAHRSTVKRYHRRLFQIHRGGTWTMSEIPKESSKEEPVEAVPDDKQSPEPAPIKEVDSEQQKEAEPKESPNADESSNVETGDSKKEVVFTNEPFPSPKGK